MYQLVRMRKYCERIYDIRTTRQTVRYNDGIEDGENALLMIVMIQNNNNQSTR